MKMLLMTLLSTTMTARAVGQRLQLQVLGLGLLQWQTKRPQE